MNGNKQIRNWEVLAKDSRDLYDALCARDNFLRIFAYFTTVSDDAIDVSNLRLMIGGFVDDEKHPEFSTIGMRTSMVLGIKRTANLIDGKRVYTVRTNTGSYYDLFWEERSEWQWQQLVNISHGRICSFSAPQGYRTALDIDEIPRISDEGSPTGLYDVRQIIQTKRS